MAGSVLLTVVSLSFLGMSSEAGAVEAWSQRPDETMDGGWVLNEELSDDPRAITPPARTAPARARGPRAGGGGATGSGRGGGGRRRQAGSAPSGDRSIGEGDQGSLALAAFKELAQSPNRLVIVTTEKEVVVTDEDGRVVRLAPNGGEREGVAGIDMRVTRTTVWSDQALVTELAAVAPPGFRAEVSYHVSSAGQLVVTFRHDPGLEVRRLYDREVR